jgi:hypothetical protein
VSIARQGDAGSTGSPCESGVGGAGGASFTGTMDWDALGGSGGDPSEPTGGTRGYVLLTW